MTSLASVAEVAAAPRLEFEGLSLPARFAGLEPECRAARQGAVVFDGSFRRWVLMRGEDRATFLQGMVTNDVALPPGSGTHAFILTQQGRVVTDLRVYVAADHLVLDFPAQAAAAGQAALERYVVADDVEMEADGAALVGIEGRDCARVLEAAGAAMPEGFAIAELAGKSVRLASATHTGEPGALVAVAPADAAAVWQALRQAGAAPVGFEALAVLRLEAGIPWVGVDMGEDTLVMEAGVGEAISFRKGCYLGQEVVERVAARGHVNRERVGLVFDGEPPAARAALSVEGKDVGFVTSAAGSPALGEAIGMGYVRREHLAPGTRLDVAGGGAARVAALPFVRGGA